jgi:antitoxin CptB
VNPADGDNREYARLRWRCRRGMKELDVLLAFYMDTRFCSAEPARQAAFARLLECQDPLLYDLILGTEEADDPDEASVLADIRRYPRN